MTISQIIALAHEEARQVVGVPPAPSPVLVRQFYDATMDEIVSRIGLLWQQWTCDLTSGEASYCLPALDRIEAGWVLDSSDNKTPIAFVHSRDATASTAYRVPESNVPTVVIVEGIGRCRLHPTPNYTKTNGLILTGYGPYIRTDYALTTENPLKVQDQTAVITGIAIKILKHIGNHEEAAIKDRDYQRQLGQIQINASDYTPAHAMERTGSFFVNGNALNPLAW